MRKMPLLRHSLSHGRCQSNGLGRRVTRHALSRATIYAARARNSANTAECLCLYTWRVTRWLHRPFSSCLMANVDPALG